MPVKKTKFQKTIVGRGWIALAGGLISLFVLMYFHKVQPLINNSSRFTPSVTPFPTLEVIKSTVGDPNMYEELAVNDLAYRLNISVEKIEVISVKPVTFGNTSLGCPKPGVMYAQVLTPGYSIELAANGRTYNYHAGLKTVVTCGD